NVGFTPSVGIWCDPAGFMAHDDDFHGFLSPVGQARPELADARVLAALVRLLGADLARGLPEAAVGAYATDAPTSASPSRLRMPSGASLLAVPNLGDVDAEVSLAVGPDRVSAPLPGLTCLLVLAELPLARFGLPGTLELATADVVAADPPGRTLAATGRSALVLRAPDGERTVLEIDAPA
ncbi:beta-galactosidase, partial [Cutibacterium acnes]